MKPYRISLFLILLTSIASLAVAQSELASTAAAPSVAQRSFATLKSLAGDWEGQVTVSPKDLQMKGDASLTHISLRVTSRGHAIVHEMQQANTPLDPSKYDHPVTILYLDAGTLTLVHYCDAGNRPRMVGKSSPNGKTVEFSFTGISGGMDNGHMHQVAFTLVDADHHTEDWTYVLPGNKPVHAHFDLHRIVPADQASR